MSKGIAPITSTNDINAIVRQINQNFQILANRTVSGSTVSTAGSAVSIPGSVTDSSQFAIYYDASGLPRVAIGSVQSSGEEVIAISVDGVNVLNALKRNPLNSADFYFNSSLVTTSLGSLTSRVSSLEERMTAAEDELADHETRIQALEDEQPSTP